MDEAEHRQVFGQRPGAGQQGLKNEVGHGRRHPLRGYWEQASTAIVKLEVEYTRKDGRKLTLPCTNIFEFDGDLISDYRIYMDIGPVFA